MNPPLPPESEWRPLLERALAEDLGGIGDITTAAVIGVGASARGLIMAREHGVVAGLSIAVAVFPMLDSSISIALEVSEGVGWRRGRCWRP